MNIFDSLLYSFCQLVVVWL